ncbi:MAG: helix-hairpin-helix domain-containing protein [Candidatus Roizmanbacteria bacterium]|nr:helix-hairpin-helix domain-containing protein [Candidatus Roizmanbacteria bacterium]
MEKIHKFLKRPNIPLIGLVISILCIIVTLIILRQGMSSQPEIEPPHIENVQKSVVVVDIEGAVQKPGVYELQENARLVHALTNAGGLIEQADRYYVAKNMNLSKNVIDEEKIYISFLIERTESVEATLSSVRINTATTSQLELLPGVGPVTASKIVKNRPYESIDELVGKKVLGQKTFENIKALIEL